MDRALVEMVEGALDDIQAWIDAGGGIFTFDDIEWDFPAAAVADGEAARLLEHKATHAIGFVCGCAAMADMTPLEFVWSLPERKQPKPRTRRATRARKG